jgi:hypothetical protein
MGSRLLVVALLTVTLITASCSNFTPLGLLAGGGPNVAANVQAGKTNSQTVGTTNNVAPSVSIRPNARVDSIDQSVNESKVATESIDNVTVNEIPPWVVLLLILGWLLPSPNEISRWFLQLFNRKRKDG